MSEKSIDIGSKELWERAKAIFTSTLMTSEEKSQADRYFGMISGVVSDGSGFNILTMNSLAADLLQREYAEKLKSSFILAGADPSIELFFKYDEDSRPPLVTPRLVSPPPQVAIKVPSTFESTLPLDLNYTFEEFVRGPSNSYAYAAAEACAMSPGKPGYNPLFIHGGTGLGKTHLMQAIGNAIRSRNSNLAVCYLTAETFLNEYVNSMTNATITEFRNKYRSIDVLLIDDVQFLAKGKGVQEEFFNTFNALQQAHKQIVMTSDVAPKNLPSLEDRLISRFEGGMVQEIESPSYETRLAILRKKAEGMNLKIPDSALKFIAEKIKSHVRAMEGALGKVSVVISAEPKLVLTDEALSQILRNLIEKEQTFKNLSIEEIQTVVARKYNVTMAQILSSERTQSIVTPRQLAMFISRKLTTKSLKEIAYAFDKKHATILHGVKSISQRLETEIELKNVLDEIVTSLGYQMSDTID